MDSLAQLFEIIVLATTGISVAALTGFIVWDSIIDARRQPAVAAERVRDDVRLASGMSQPFSPGVQSGTAKAA